MIGEPSRSARDVPGAAISLFLLKRFATFVATLLVASAIVFAVLDVLPGNVADVMLGEPATPEARQALIDKLGLGHPPIAPARASGRRCCSPARRGSANRG